MKTDREQRLDIIEPGIGNGSAVEWLIITLIMQKWRSRGIIAEGAWKNQVI